MKAEPTESPSWFQDDAALERELRDAVLRRQPLPVVPGYDNLREIGQGGQGTVYVATQRGTHRSVAIKVLREPLAAAPEARRRFEREIDLASGLRHPHIVAVYDGGAAQDGRPYLVMEFVEGTAIDHCAVAKDALAGPFSRRRVAPLLRLFATVCDAAQHAHHKGVIHRDLKPSNIRVDQDGVARVLDFGLAKAIGPASPTSVTATEATSARFVGSLPWASPEQAAGRSDAIDVRSDVYALGVVLFQLTTGHFPYDVTGDLHEALRNIAEVPPASPRRHVPRMDADLVTIALRALAKDPERRYQSAGDLAHDLRAYLAGEPIEARRDSLWYLLRITARRRKRTVILAAALLVMVLAAAVVSFVQWRRADAARAVAIDASETSESALNFLLDVVFNADPDVGGKDIRLIEVVDRAAAQIDTKFGAKTDVRMRLHERFSILNDKLGRPDRAEAEALAAVEIARAAGGEEHPATLVLASQAAFLRHKAGRSKEAVAELERVVETQTRLAGAAHPETLASVAKLGKTLIGTGRLRDAATLQEEALVLARRELGPGADTTITLMEGLAHARADLGDLKDAELLLREAHEKRVAHDGADNTTTLNTLANLVVLLIQQGRFAEAEPLGKAHHERLLAKCGSDHAATLNSANSYAKLLQDLDRLDEAATLMLATWQGRERVLGPDHPHTLVSLANLATTYAYQKKYAEAEALQRKTLDRRLENLGPAHFDTLISYNNLAATLRDQGRFEEALATYELAARGAEQTFGKDHWATATFGANYASTLTSLGRRAEAEPILIEALATVEKRLGAGHQQAKIVRRYLVKLYEAESRPAEAARYRDPTASPP